MESRTFIRQAAPLIKRLEYTPANGDETSQNIQREINQLFQGLQNPTLPSAYRLRDAALGAGYSVNPQILQRLSQFEFIA